MLEDSDERLQQLVHKVWVGQDKRQGDESREDTHTDADMHRDAHDCYKDNRQEYELGHRVEAPGCEGVLKVEEDTAIVSKIEVESLAYVSKIDVETLPETKMEVATCSNIEVETLAYEVMLAESHQVVADLQLQLRQVCVRDPLASSQKQALCVLCADAVRGMCNVLMLCL